MTDQQRLRIALERLSDLERLVSDWIWETDPELRLTFVSRRTIEALGRPPLELVGKHLPEIGTFPEKAEAAALLDPAAPRPFRDLAFEADHLDGGRRLFYLSALPVFSHPSGEFAGLRGTARDVTELKAREEGLFQAKLAAEAANRSKTEFLANISHELRTPLNAIIGFSEIIRTETFGPIGTKQYLEYIGDVLDSANHLLGVINDVLDIAKVEAGKLELSDTVVNIGALVTSALRLVRERAHRGGIDISLDLPATALMVNADERKLKQILLNLLTNAIKFTPAGGTVRVSAGIAPDGGPQLSVIDTGIGIAAEDIEKALAPFGQIDSRLARRYEGTGLGLPLSRAIARLHGGELTIASEPGRGTTVTVTLPPDRIVASPPPVRTPG